MARFEIKVVKSGAKCRNGKGCQYWNDGYPWGAWIPRGDKALRFTDYYFCLDCAKGFISEIESEVEMIRAQLLGQEIESGSFDLLRGDDD